MNYYKWACVFNSALFSYYLSIRIIDYVYLERSLDIICLLVAFMAGYLLITFIYEDLFDMYKRENRDVLNLCHEILENNENLIDELKRKDAYRNN